MLLVTEFTNERGETYTVLQLLKRLRRAIIQIDGILFDHQERIEVLEIDVEKIKNNIDDIKEQLLNIINRVDIVENKVEIVEETLTTIETNISSIEAILDTHDGDISALNTVVKNITVELNELQGIVDSIPIVSASPLNGYIKIDGVDTPVFIGESGGSGGVGGGGEIIASYNDFLNTEKNTPTKLKNLILSFDIPDYNKNIELSGMMAGQCNSSYPRGTIIFYGYDEENNEFLLISLDTNDTNSTPYYRWQYIINLFGDGGGISLGVTNNSPYENTMNNKSYDGPTISRKIINSNKIKRVDVYIKYNELPIDIFKLYPFNILISKYSDDGSGGGSGGSDENNNAVYATKMNTLTNDDLNTYKNIWSLPCPPSAIGENSRFEYDATYAISVDKIDKINFQCSIMGAEMNLGEININSFEENFVYMKINLIGGTRKINDTEYYTSSNIEVIISNSNTSTKTSRVLARLNSNRGGNGAIGVDDNISFNMMFTGDEVADRNLSMARGMLKSFYDIKELI